MYDDDFSMEKNLVAQAMRYVIIDRLPTLVRVLGLDPGMDNDELYAEILRLCLFDRNRRENPAATFQRRLNDGDFLPVQPGEDPDHLRPGRQPMTDDELDAEVARARADSTYWDGYSHAAAEYIVRNVVMCN